MGRSNNIQLVKGACQHVLIKERNIRNNGIWTWFRDDSRLCDINAVRLKLSCSEIILNFLHDFNHVLHKRTAIRDRHDALHFFPARSAVPLPNCRINCRRCLSLRKTGSFDPYSPTLFKLIGTECFTSLFTFRFKNFASWRFCWGVHVTRTRHNAHPTEHQVPQNTGFHTQWGLTTAERRRYWRLPSRFMRRSGEWQLLNDVSGPRRCQETSGNYCQSTLCNIPDRRTRHLHSGGSQKSRIWGCYSRSCRFNDSVSTSCSIQYRTEL